MGLSILAGLVVAGVIGVVLDVAEVPYGSVAGAFVGGLVAAWVLYARRGKATAAGFVVGLFSLPVQLAIFMVLMSSGLYTPPAVPEIAPSDLLVALAVTVVMQVVGGVLGGILGGVFHHPPLGVVEATRSYLPPPPPPPRPEKYCVQCGAGLAKETPICPACGARQPQ